MKLLITFLAILSLTACNSTPKATAYLALADVAHTVDAAMKVYAKACVAGNVSPAQQERIDGIHDRYRLAFGSALRLARHNWKAKASESVTLVFSELVGALQELRL